MEKRTIQLTFTSVADPTSRPKQIKFGLLSDFLKKKKRDDHYVVNKERNAGTMHLTEKHVVLGSVIALFRFAPTVLLVRKLLTKLQITKILFTTNPHADQRGHSDYHILHFKTCNENSSLCQNQKSRIKVPLSVCPFASLRWMCFQRPQDLQIYTRKSKCHFSIISPLQTEPI